LGVKTQSQHDSGFVDQFRVLSEQVASYYQGFGARLKPYHDPALPHFSALPLDHQRNAVRHLGLLSTITQWHSSGKVDAGNDAQALWCALKTLKLRPGSDLFNLLEAEDVLEIYTFPEQTQIWRNLNCMAVCSYTLEEVHCFSWDERYDRDAKSDEQIHAAVKELVRLNGRGYVTNFCGQHFVTERFSEERFKLRSESRLLVPLLEEQGRLAGAVKASRAQILETLPVTKEREKKPGLKLVKG
jgi:hypothetical protein